MGLGAGGGFGFHNELLACAADVMDFDERHAQDAKDVGGVGGGDADVPFGENDEDGKHEGGAGDADVQAGVEKVVLVLEQLELEPGIARAVLHVLDLAHAGVVDERLNGGEDHDEDDAEDVDVDDDDDEEDN